MNSKQLKFENPARLDELKPFETLQKIRLEEGYFVCDIGAGTGIFTLPAARITKNKVYALDINEEMLAIIRGKIETESISNVELMKVKDDHLLLHDNVIDIALMVTVLHEIEDKTSFLKEVKRILKKGGKISKNDSYPSISGI